MSFNFIRFLLVVFVLVVEVAFVAVVVVMLQCHVGVRWRLCVCCVCVRRRPRRSRPNMQCYVAVVGQVRFVMVCIYLWAITQWKYCYAMRYTLYNQYNIILENLTALVIWVQPD